MALKYVLTANGNIKVKDGMPLVIDDEVEGAEEMTLDGIGLYAKVPTLQNEAKTRRLELKEAKATLTKYEELGIDLETFPTWKSDAEKAIEVKKNLDESKLIEAGKVEEIKAAVKAEAEANYKKFEKQAADRIKDLETAVQNSETTVRGLMVDDRFNTSPYISENLIITPKMARKIFGDSFKVERGEDGVAKTIGYVGGEPIMSKKKVGEYASFDEALQIMVDSDPEADAYRRAKTTKTPVITPTKTFSTQDTNPENMSSVDKIKAGLMARKAE